MLDIESVDQVELQAELIKMIRNVQRAFVAFPRLGKFPGLPVVIRSWQQIIGDRTGHVVGDVIGVEKVVNVDERGILEVLDDADGRGRGPAACTRSSVYYFVG